MSSTRFPGKVLAPFRGEPIVRHVLRAVEQVEAIDEVILLTSDEPSDDPLTAYMEFLGVRVFRGPLDDVFGRFCLCARQFPTKWLLRLCADSPLLSPRVLHEVTSHAGRGDCDIVTTRFAPRFPKGQNAELIRSEALLSVDPAALTAHQREHVTPYFYENPAQFRIAHARAVDIGLPADAYTVDTPADLARLEGLMRDTAAAHV